MARRKSVIHRHTADSMPIQRAFDEFIVEKEIRNLSEKTISSYKWSYKYFQTFHNFSTETTTDEITQKHVHDWIIELKKDIKLSSVNKYLSDVRVFLYWCMEEERGYVKPFNISLMKTQEEQLKLYSDEELRKLLKKPNKQDTFVEWRTWTMVNWMLGTGNRISTVCSIKMGDVDFTYKEIAVQRTKNNRAQVIPLSPALESALREYIKIWRYNADENEWLFPTVEGMQMEPDNIRGTYIKYCKKRGVSRHNFHGLRHNFAKGWIKNNGNVFALQKILGHSSLDMTKKYVKLFSEDLKADYEMYSPLDTIKQQGKRKRA